MANCWACGDNLGDGYEGYCDACAEYMEDADLPTPVTPNVTNNRFVHDTMMTLADQMAHLAHLADLIYFGTFTPQMIRESLYADAAILDDIIRRWRTEYVYQ